MFALLESICAANDNSKVPSFSGYKNVLKRAFIKKIFKTQTDFGKDLEIDLNQSKHDFLCDLSRNAFQIRKTENLLKEIRLNKHKNIMNENTQLIWDMKENDVEVTECIDILFRQHVIYGKMLDLMKIQKVKSYVDLYNNIATMRFAFNKQLELEGIEITKNILRQIRKIKTERPLSPLLQYFERKEKIFERKRVAYDIYKFKLYYGFFKDEQRSFESLIRKKMKNKLL